ncbi:Putative addiction module component [Micrococcales bacterium KH10]|nr:Putative addiction module component [Micrococcales bacterium KH10]
MTAELAEYIAAGKALDVNERLEVAHQLLLSVDEDSDLSQADVDAAWDEAIDRRVSDVLSNPDEFVDGRRAHDHIRAEIAALRK